jgi:hypothetical protein
VVPAPDQPSYEHLFARDVAGQPVREVSARAETGRASIEWNAALELEHIDLQDALVLVLLVADEPRFARASTRWLGRLCLEDPSSFPGSHRPRGPLSDDPP